MTGASGLNWGHEAIASLWWIARAFVITTILLLIGVAALVRFTKWGRMFWRIGGGYFHGRQSWPAWGSFAAVLLLAIFGVRLTVLISYAFNDLYTSLQKGVQALAGHAGDLAHAEHLFWNSIRLFGVLSAIVVVFGVVTLWVKNAFQIRWWCWLNERFTDDWLTGRAYYRNRFIDTTIDNADQRIQQDVNDFVSGSYALAFGGPVGGFNVNGNGVVGAGLTLVSFTPILWRLSGSLNFFGWHIPKALVFAVFAWTAFSTVIAFWLGYPLIKLNFWFQRRTADFRYSLIRLRDNAESVALYHGESAERTDLFGRFNAMISTYWSRLYRLLRYYGWNLVTGQISSIFTVLVLGPRVFAGTTTIGDLQQAISAFSQVHDAVSMPQSSFDAFSYFRSTLVRLDGMLEANGQARTLSALETSELTDGLELQDVRVAKPDGTQLITDLNLSLEPGDALVVKGNSGCGKTTLLRTIGELWPYAAGHARRPLGMETLFLPQFPYLPLGDLRTAVAYPADPAHMDDAVMSEVLRKVSLGHLADRLNDEQDWSATLSPGERQRIAFARIMLIKPKLAFLDESTSAVDEGLEYALYNLIRTEAPDTMLVSVAHRSTVDPHHTHRLHLDGVGGWELSRLRVPAGV